MRHFLVSFILLSTLYGLHAQIPQLKGQVRALYSKQPISQAVVKIQGSSFLTQTDPSGNFKLTAVPRGSFLLVITTPDYFPKQLPIDLSIEVLDIGVVYLERDIFMEKRDNLISLTEAELWDDRKAEANVGLLQATRDIYLSRAAFDFGQAFFKVRGYDSRNGWVLINGIRMNKLVDGRPQWNNWGGLNDIIRNQDFSYALQASRHSFGGLLGVTNIDMRPSTLRPGMRVTTSASNRTYAGRLMVTYNSANHSKGLAYAISASRRWAKQGFIEGTQYEASSFYGSLEYQCNKKNGLLLTAILASNRRGQSAAITDEVFGLAGARYNPYWGLQNGKKRNSRQRRIREPIIMLNHTYSSNKINIRTGIAYQFGLRSKSRLGYFEAPNPDPTYYRYLPSFYINSPIGANFTNAALARDGFISSPQVSWNDLYVANSSAILNGKAAYVLQSDTIEERSLFINSLANYKINDFIRLDIGGDFRNLNSKNYAVLEDLLGATYHEDSEPFSDTLNDVKGTLEKSEGEIFGYNYNIGARSIESFGQLSLKRNGLEGFLAVTYARVTYQRNGLFLNERYPENSLGKGNAAKFTNMGIKGGYTHKISGRHWIAVNGAIQSNAPFYQNVFVNPRDHKEVVPKIGNEKINSVDLNYFLRFPGLKGRLSGYYTRFQNETDVNFFFVNSGLGSAFVQEVITGLDKLHMGIEFGFEYEITSGVKINSAGAIGKYPFASDPDVSISFDVSERERNLINSEGRTDLGPAIIKDHKLSQGPQKALSFGIEYRDPKYWWIGLSANYMANNYAGISTISRTQSFYLDPDTGTNFPGATEQNVTALLAQKKLDDFYLLNVVGGKSWLKNGKYISVFVSLNNAFNTAFKTGGYEQSRNGNYKQYAQDNLSGTPSFAPKFWYGYGRTFFLNVAVSL